MFARLVCTLAAGSVTGMTAGSVTGWRDNGSGADGTDAVDSSVSTTEAMFPDVTAIASIAGTEKEVGPVVQSFVDQLPFDGARFGRTGDELVLDVTESGTPHVLTLRAA